MSQPQYTVPPTGSLPTFFTENRNTGRTQSATLAYGVELSLPVQGTIPAPTGNLPTFMEENKNTGRTDQATEKFVAQFTKQKKV